MAALLVAGVAAACGGEERAGADAEVAAFAQFDSAGVTVAEAPYPDWGGGEPWRVEAAPVFELGGDEAEGEEAFAEISAALLLPDGQVLVADPGRALIHRFSGEGSPLGAFGGQGEGPGELGVSSGFGGMGFGPGLGLHRLDDGTLLVLDPGLGVHAFDAEGSFLRLERRSGRVSGFAAGTADVRRVLSDGTLVLSSVDARVGRRVVGVVPPESGSFQAVDGVEFGAPVAAAGRITVGSPFVVRGGVAVRGGATPEVFVSTGQDPEIRVLDLQGQVTRILRYGFERPSTQPYLPVVRASMEERPGDADVRQARLTAFDQLEHPERVPALRSLLWDESGHLWIERFAPPGEEGDPTFDILSAEGRWLGTLTLPMGPAGKILHVGSDRIAIRDTDAMGSHMLRVHRLHR